MTTPPRYPTPGTSATDAAPGAETNPAARVIKRYSNRKLYDTVESRYVTLPQIAELLRRGEDVRIIDNNSKEDLTSVTLAQILYEEERKQSRALPLTALKDLIHTSGEKIMSSLRESPMGKLIGAKPEDGAVPGATQTSAPAPASTPPPTANPGSQPPPASMSASEAAASGRFAEMLEQSRVSVAEWQHRVDERVRKVLESFSPSSQVEKLQTEVRRLTQRLEELEARIDPDAAARKDGE